MLFRSQIVFAGDLQGEKLFDEILPTLFSEGKKLRGGGVLSIVIAGPLLSLFKKTGYFGNEVAYSTGNNGIGDNYFGYGAIVV